MRLSEVGELGLLRELEAPRPDRRAPSTTRPSSTAGSSSPRTRSSRASTSGSTGSRWRDLGFRAAAVNLSDLVRLGGAPGGALRHARAARRRRARRRARALRGPRRDGRAGRAAATRRGPTASCSASPRSAARSAFPGARAPVPATSSSSPGRSAPPARRSARAATCGRRCASRKGCGSARVATRDARRLGRARGRRGPHRRRSGCRARDRPRRACRWRATLDDLGFGEDFELLAATRDPLGFAVVGRCEEGEGVVLLHDGAPYELPRLRALRLSADPANAEPY